MRALEKNCWTHDPHPRGLAPLALPEYRARGEDADTIWTGRREVMPETPHEKGKTNRRPERSRIGRGHGTFAHDAVNMEIRRKINQKIIDAVGKSGLTHNETAKLAQTSRSRLTALLNRNTAGISTDLMLRILLALGYRATITFSRSRPAA